ncbi:MAG: hypothetical protein JO045_07840 [Mycobacterium sp.]|nr:hypothetical protein [Mycobacterium sp.]
MLFSQLDADAGGTRDARRLHAKLAEVAAGIGGIFGEWLTNRIDIDDLENYWIGTQVASDVHMVSACGFDDRVAHVIDAVN